MKSLLYLYCIVFLISCNGKKQESGYILVDISDGDSVFVNKSTIKSDEGFISSWIKTVSIDSISLQYDRESLAMKNNNPHYKEYAYSTALIYVDTIQNRVQITREVSYDKYDVKIDSIVDYFDPNNFQKVEYDQNGWEIINAIRELSAGRPFKRELSSLEKEMAGEAPTPRSTE